MQKSQIPSFAPASKGVRVAQSGDGVPSPPCAMPPNQEAQRGGAATKSWHGHPGRVGHGRGRPCHNVGAPLVGARKSAVPTGRAGTRPAPTSSSSCARCRGTACRPPVPHSPCGTPGRASPASRDCIHPFERRLRLCDPEVATVNPSWGLTVGSSSKEELYIEGGRENSAKAD